MSSESPMEADQLLGAIDIVEAFTSLRHELKLQVRSGRELQQAIDQRLQQLESQLSQQAAWVKKLDSAGTIAAGTAALSAPVTAHDSRQLAEAIAEIEEHLQRSVDMLAASAAAAAPEPLVQNTREQITPAADPIKLILEEFDHTISQSRWTSKLFAGPLLRRLRSAIEQARPPAPTTTDDSAPDHPAPADPASLRLEVARRGLELLLERTRRLMLGCSLERHDVVGLPFDPESMRAIDVVATTDVPATHVAEQLRPLYLWQGQVLRFADVRLAK